MIEKKEINCKIRWIKSHQNIREIEDLTKKKMARANEISDIIAKEGLKLENWKILIEYEESKCNNKEFILWKWRENTELDMNRPKEFINGKITKELRNTVRKDRKNKLENSSSGQKILTIKNFQFIFQNFLVVDGIKNPLNILICF